MKQIKFRAWDKDNKIMHQPCSLVSNWNNETMSYQTDVENYNYMQFTGLLDKNGKEVYLGDIIFDEDGEYSKTCVIEWNDESAGFFGKAIEDDDSYSMVEIDGEVIGNIYANPELKKD